MNRLIQIKIKSKNIAVNNALVLILFAILGLCACQTMEAVTQVGATLGTATGVITQAQANSIQKSVVAVSKTFEDFTPEQEYYIGRTIGAVIMDKYKSYNDQAANNYINLVGQTLAKASERPDTFGGYHFMIQNSDEINAFAAPGGLIFVTRGMLRCCNNEDELAAVLAHEISHVQFKHGLQSIKKSRITSALTTIGMEGAKNLAGEKLAKVTEEFECSISDITSTLIDCGYSRAYEKDADKSAIQILRRVGYNPGGLVDMLNIMKTKLQPGGLDFSKTHPSPSVRIADVQNYIDKDKQYNSSAKRDERFENNLKGI